MRVVLALILFLAPLAGLAQDPVEPPNAKTGVVLPSPDYRTEAFQFGPPRPVEVWELTPTSTVGVYVDGPLPARNWRLLFTIQGEDGAEAEVTAFRLPSPWRGPSGCACGQGMRILSWEMLSETLAELVLLANYYNQRSFLDHPACGEMCTETVETEYRFLVDVRSPIRCLACDIPVRVSKRIYANDYEAGRLVFQVETETLLGMRFIDGVLTLTPVTDELDARQQPWPGTYRLAGE